MVDEKSRLSKWRSAKCPGRQTVLLWSTKCHGSTKCPGRRMPWSTKCPGRRNGVVKMFVDEMPLSTKWRCQNGGRRNGGRRTVLVDEMPWATKGRCQNVDEMPWSTKCLGRRNALVDEMALSKWRSMKFTGRQTVLVDEMPLSTKCPDRRNVCR